MTPRLPGIIPGPKAPHGVPGSPEWRAAFLAWRAASLGAKQELFFALFATRLVPFILESGHGIRGGELWRPKEMVDIYASRGTGSRASVHPLKLAVDLNIARPDGSILERSADHLPFGAFWETVHPACRWGGRFSRPDGNHYSMEFEGRA